MEVTGVLCEVCNSPAGCASENGYVVCSEYCAEEANKREYKACEHCHAEITRLRDENERLKALRVECEKDLNKENSSHSLVVIEWTELKARIAELEGAIEAALTPSNHHLIYGILQKALEAQDES